MIVYSPPANLVIMGNVVSMEVAPPEEMADNLPVVLIRRGIHIKVKISLTMFDKRAIKLIVSFLKFFKIILERL